MRKEINSKSKRKWVAGGLAAFASVALLTTGFATWVVINNSAKKDNDVTVNIDTAENKSVRMTFTVTGTLKLAESKDTVVEKPVVIGTKEGEQLATNPLTVTISAFSIKFGAAVQNTDYTKLNFSIAAADSKKENSADNKVASEGNLLKTYRAGTGFIYFDAPKSIDVDLSKAVADKTTGTKTWTYTGDTALKFSWGSFFGGNSPVQYYNSDTFTKKDGEDADANTIADIADKAVLELNAMHNQLDGKTITLTATLDNK